MKFPVVFYCPHFFFFSPLLSSQPKKFKSATRPFVLYSNGAKIPKVLSVCPDSKDGPLCIWSFAKTSTSANADHEDS